MVNLTIEVVVVLLSTIPLYFSFIVLFKQHRRHPDIVLLTMAAAWLCYALYNTLAAIAYFSLSNNLFWIRSFLLAIFLILVEIAMGYINEGRLHPARFPIISILAVALIYSLFLPNAVLDLEFPNGDKSLGAGGMFRTVSIVALSYAVIIYTYFTYKIYMNSTQELSYWARYHFIGALILGPVAFLTFVVQLNWIIPGITEFILGVGVLISAISLSKKPQLIYILPFKAIKLLVIKQESGLAIYNYMWIEDELDIHAPLFSSAVESINSFSRSAIDKGNIIEITFEDAILIIEAPKNQDLYYALLATKTSYTLKIGLTKFATMFFKTFEKQLNSQFVIETSSLTGADDLIREAFPYVPILK
ncbi:MAG: hypothetical protein GPJ54_03565 [Candidatus Heimdallarchaeota archaeon]|nr:hypothetical protein [Candidatus Heimdallarchaeota archaeon]